MADRLAANKARQAKLLAKSNERLQRITGAAKGDGRVISDAAVGIRPAPPAPASTALAATPGRRATADVSARAVQDEDDDDPAEIDLGGQDESELLQKRQRAQLQAALGGGGMGAGGMFGGMGPSGGEDMFAQMMASLQAGGPGGGPSPFGPGMGDPLAAGTSPFGMMGGGPPVSPFPTTPRSLLDKLFPVVHLLSMVGLAIYVVCYLEPSRRLALYGGSVVEGMEIATGSAWEQWGMLLYTKVTEIADVPLFWLFITVELVLQTTRIFLIRNRPEAPGIVSSILPLLSQFSPQGALILRTGIKYYALLSILLNDLAILVFCLGLAVIYGNYLSSGGVAESVVPNGAAQAVLEKGWNAARGEL